MLKDEIAIGLNCAIEEASRLSESRIPADGWIVGPIEHRGNIEYVHPPERGNEIFRRGHRGKMCPTGRFGTLPRDPDEPQRETMRITWTRLDPDTRWAWELSASLSVQFSGTSPRTFAGCGEVVIRVEYPRGSSARTVLSSRNLRER